MRPGLPKIAAIPDRTKSPASAKAEAAKKRGSTWLRAARGAPTRKRGGGGQGERGGETRPWRAAKAAPRGGNPPAAAAAGTASRKAASSTTTASKSALPTRVRDPARRPQH